MIINLWFLVYNVLLFVPIPVNKQNIDFVNKQLTVKKVLIAITKKAFRRKHFSVLHFTWTFICNHKLVHFKAFFGIEGKKHLKDLFLCKPLHFFQKDWKIQIFWGTKMSKNLSRTYYRWNKPIYYMRTSPPSTLCVIGKHE